MSKRGRPPKLTADQRRALSAIVEATSTATLEEIGQELQRRTGVTAHGQTLVAALEDAGWSRVRDGSGVEIKPADSEASRYGYTDVHRRLAPEQRYPSCLTHREWGLVEDIFDTTGKRGVPLEYPRHVLVDACCYVVRTGCSWRMLPKEFPPWQNVYRSFRRWSEQGKFEQMHDRLRAMWREREGRTDAPTAAVLDAHPRVARHKAGRAAMTPARRSRGASAMSSSTPSSWYWR